MKNTLRHLAAIVAVSFAACFAWSCSDDDKDEPIEVATLPDAAKAFLAAHYSGSQVVSAVRDKNGGNDEYEVRMSDGQEVTFDPSGQWTDVDAPVGHTVPAGLVPEAIVLYVVTNYPDQGINEISRSVSGYEIELTNGVDLLFDSIGNFLRVDS